MRTLQLNQLQHLSPLTHGQAPPHPPNLPPLTSLATTATTASTVTGTKRKAPCSTLESPQLGASAVALINNQFNQSHPHLLGPLVQLQPLPLTTPGSSAILSRSAQVQLQAPLVSSASGNVLGVSALAGIHSTKFSSASPHTTTLNPPPMLQLQFPTHSEMSNTNPNNHHSLQPFSHILATSPHLPLPGSPTFGHRHNPPGMGSLQQLHLLQKDPYQDFLRSFGEVCQNPIATSISVLTALQNSISEDLAMDNDGKDGEAEAGAGSSSNSSGASSPRTKPTTNTTTTATTTTAASPTDPTQPIATTTTTTATTSTPASTSTSLKLSKSHSSASNHSTTGQNGPNQGSSSFLGGQFGTKPIPLRHTASSMNSSFTVITPQTKSHDPAIEPKLLFEYIKILMAQQQILFSELEPHPLSSSSTSNRRLLQSEPHRNGDGDKYKLQSPQNASAMISHLNNNNHHNGQHSTTTTTTSITDPTSRSPQLPNHSTLAPHNISPSTSGSHLDTKPAGPPNIQPSVIIHQARKLFDSKHPKANQILDILTPASLKVKIASKPAADVAKTTMNDDESTTTQDKSTKTSTPSTPTETKPTSAGSGLNERLRALATFLNEEVPDSSQTIIPDGLILSNFGTKIISAPSSPHSTTSHNGTNPFGTMGDSDDTKTDEKTTKNVFSWYKFLIHCFHPTQLSGVIRNLHQQVQLRQHLATNTNYNLRQGSASRPGSGQSMVLSQTLSNHHGHMSGNLSGRHQPTTTPLSVSFSPLLPSKVPHYVPPRLTELGTGSTLHQQISHQMGAQLSGQLSAHSPLGAHNHVTLPPLNQQKPMTGLHHLTATNQDREATTASPRNLHPLGGHSQSQHSHHSLGNGPNPTSTILINKTPLPNTTKNRTAHVVSRTTLGLNGDQRGQGGLGLSGNVAGGGNNTSASNNLLLTQAFAHLHTISNPSPVLNAQAPQQTNVQLSAATMDQFNQLEMLDNPNLGPGSNTRPNSLLTLSAGLGPIGQHAKNSLLNQQQPPVVGNTATYTKHQTGQWATTPALVPAAAPALVEQEKTHTNQNGSTTTTTTTTTTSVTHGPLDFSRLIQLSPHASHMTAGPAAPLVPLQNLADLPHQIIPGFNGSGTGGGNAGGKGEQQ